MATLTDYQSLTQYKDWILEPLKLQPSVHAPGQWDHIDGLPEVLNNIVTKGPQLNQGTTTAVYTGTMNVGTDTVRVVLRCAKFREPMFFRQDVDALNKAIAAEFKVARSLRHPNILQFLGIWTLQPPVGWATIPALVYAYCEGGSSQSYLAQHAQQKRLPLITDVASGLQYLHQYDIVHGDITPNNIFIQVSGESVRAVIGDFGTVSICSEAKAFGRCTQRTWRFVPPELAGKLNTAWFTSKAADIFSFSFTALTIVSDRQPFPSIAGHLKATELVRDEKERPARDDHACAELSDTLWELLVECWHDEPEKRLAASSVVAQLNALNQATE